MSIKEKVDNSLRFVREQILSSHSPIVAWSGGKDSQVVLWLAKQIIPEIRVAYFEMIDDARKNAFVHEMANVWDLRLQILQPIARDVVGRGDHIEVVHFYRVGAWVFHLGLQGRDGNLGNNSICAIDKYLSQEKIDIEKDYPDADLILHGHKSADADSMYGEAPLSQNLLLSPNGKTRLAYPLKDWTDADVWEATRILNIPQNYRRYDKQTGAKIKSDVFNSDVYNLCTNCCKGSDGCPTAYCPKLNEPINSIADTIRPVLDRNYQAYRQAFVSLYKWES